MKLQFLSTTIVSILLCASCQSQGDSNAVDAMEENSQSHFGIDVEALGYIVSGPMALQMDSRALSNFKQDHPIDQLVSSGYISLCQPRADRVMIELTAKGEKLRSLFRKSKGPPAGGFIDSLGELDCPPFKQ